MEHSTKPTRLILLLFIALNLFGTFVLSQEKRLIKYLVERYRTFGKTGRPVNNPNETITVEYGVNLIQILDLDERNQILSINVWITYTSAFTFFTPINDLSEFAVSTPGIQVKTTCSLFPCSECHDGPDQLQECATLRSLVKNTWI